MPEMTLASLKGVGPKTQAALSAAGLDTLTDLLIHLPIAYQDMTRETKIIDLHDQQFAVCDVVVQKKSVAFGRQRTLICTVADPSEPAQTLQLRFFHFHRAQAEKLQAGTRLQVAGIAHKQGKRFEMRHPGYQVLAVNDPLDLPIALTPTYASIPGVASTLLARLTSQALVILKKAPFIEEPLTESRRAELGIMHIVDAFMCLHQPAPEQSVEELMSPAHPARKRLIIDELLAQHLSMRLLRDARAQHMAQAMVNKDTYSDALLAELPYTLTDAQSRVLELLWKDMAQTTPMVRLLQGDVGAGKTVVAALAATRAIAHGGQVLLMAPTEILAEQHLISFTEWLAPRGIHVTLLTGKLPAAVRAERLRAIASGEAHFIIGTHALIQSTVTMHAVNLVIIDEQHRFGVAQRATLREKAALAGTCPHQLYMTATPIPRSLAMSLFADMDIANLDELPPGRKPVTTVVLANNRRDEVIERIRLAHQAGQQIYWVCTLIESSEHVSSEAAEEIADYLRAAIPSLSIGLVHGRMGSAEKTTVMASFAAGKAHVLVATTVIEVGVNVPNANIMVIENAERLGLAQLHQLRGRVGRGAAQSYCLLFYQSPLTAVAKQRLQVMRETQDGFKIAEYDLKLRGPGDIFGTQQTGIVACRVANLLRDSALAPTVAMLADELFACKKRKLVSFLECWRIRKQAEIPII